MSFNPSNMKDLTSLLLNNDITWNYKINEFLNYSNVVYFDDGTEQQNFLNNIPEYQITISYKGLSLTEYEVLRTKYEQNNTNVFKIVFPSGIDTREVETNVFRFEEFSFEISPGSSISKPLFSGYVSVVSSLFFNFEDYQEQYEMNSSYNITTSTNRDFIDLIENNCLTNISHNYLNNNILTNRFNKDKNGLLKIISFNFLVKEEGLLELRNFYRNNLKKTFGCPALGIPKLYDFYIENQSDYIDENIYVVRDYLIEQDDYVVKLNYFIEDYGIVFNSRLVNDSFSYEKNTFDLYNVKMEVIEVKNETD